MLCMPGHSPGSFYLWRFDAAWNRSETAYHHRTIAVIPSTARTGRSSCFYQSILSTRWVMSSIPQKLSCQSSLLIHCGVWRPEINLAPSLRCISRAPTCTDAEFPLLHFAQDALFIAILANLLILKRTETTWFLPMSTCLCLSQINRLYWWDGQVMSPSFNGWAVQCFV